MSDIAALVADNLDIWTGAFERKSGAGRGGGKRINLYGIERLRALILDLAVRGKLVPPEGPAPDARAIVPASPGAFSIPASWRWTTVQAVADCRLGKMLDARKNKGIRKAYLRNANVRWFDFEITDLLTMPFEENELVEFSLFTGDVLICEGGEPGRAAVWDGRARDIYFQKALHRVRFGNMVDPNFFVLTLKRSAEFNELSVYFTGSGIQHFTGRNLARFSFPLPPLAEQRRIVAKVDELMALCDALERESADAMAAHQALVKTLLASLVNSADAADLAPNWARLESHFDTLFTTDASIEALKQTVLELAVRGKLVTQYQRDEATVPKLKGERTQSAPPFPIPKGWQYRPLKALGQQIGGGTPSKARMDFWDGPIPWISPKDMKKDYLSEAELSVSEAALHGSSIKMIAPDSLLFVVRGMILAHSFPVAIAKAHITINQDMKAIELYAPEMAEYLLRALKGLKPLMLARVERSSHGTCRLDAVAYGDFPVPIPPLAEQRRIVAKVDELMALCDSLKTRIADAAETRRFLADAITQRAAA